MKRIGLYRRFLLFLIVFLTVMSLSSSVAADIGPKPQITIIVEHPPEGVFYLDLLIEDPGDMDNLRDERDTLDQAMLAVLEAYDADGWRPALAGGTRAPLWGSLTGEQQGERSIHRFTYMGVPDRFKIIIVTQDLDVNVTDVLERESFQAELVYDYSSRVISRPSQLAAYARQFAFTYLATLLVEGLILLAFSFSLRRNGLRVVLVNLITQVFLTATLGTVLITQGQLAAMMLLIPLELLIMLAETIAYARLLRGHTRSRRIVYALVANAVSALAGLVMVLLG